MSRVNFWRITFGRARLLVPHLELEKPHRVLLLFGVGGDVHVGEEELDVEEARCYVRAEGEDRYIQVGGEVGDERTMPGPVYRHAKEAEERRSGD